MHAVHLTTAMTAIKCVIYTRVAALPPGRASKRSERLTVAGIFPRSHMKALAGGTGGWAWGDQDGARRNPRSNSRGTAGRCNIQWRNGHSGHVKPLGDNRESGITVGLKEGWIKVLETQQSRPIEWDSLRGADKATEGTPPQYETS
ncbi:hypothetical protein V493_00080 [Pseudogymnoascus sp. VKM F-4281 (FW-2241)]|nr:hypothetical protein V493_00080 [Pseudogymnoascus sp. VKM F-4281 (FW-2241)]